MPITIREIADGDGLAILWEGNVNGNDLNQIGSLLFAEPDKASRWMWAWISFSGARLSEMSAADARSLADRDKKLATMTRKGLPVAVVAPDDLQFGFSRMWQVLAEETGWEIAVFREPAEAETWVRERVAAKFGVNLDAFLRPSSASLSEVNSQVKGSASAAPESASKDHFAHSPIVVHRYN